MANEVVHGANTGTVYYFRVFDSSGQVWNTSGTPAFEAWQDGNVTDYDIALTDKTSGEYIGTFPSCDAGRYRVKIYKRAGANPAITDKVRGQGWILWDGTSEIFQADEDDITNAHTITDALIGTTFTSVHNIYDERT